MLKIPNNASKATELIVTKFYKEAPGVEDTKICPNRAGHITNMATTLIYGKMVKKNQNLLHSQWTD